MTFHESLKEYREVVLDMKQGSLAKSIGVSQSALSNYETGRRVPSHEILRKIADEGNTPFHRFLEFLFPDQYGRKIPILMLMKEHQQSSIAGFINTYTPLFEQDSNMRNLIATLAKLNKGERAKIINETQKKANKLIFKK